jgi:hypothetical protein
MSFLQKMLSSSSQTIKKYALYATGELILIVFGIYLALQLDDWKKVNERHSDELEILAEIADGFQRDIGDLNFNIGLHETAARSGEIILSHLENRLPYHDSLSRHFAQMLWYSRITIVKGPFDNFKTKGLDIITNDSLRGKITAMYDIEYAAIQMFERNTFLPDDYILQVHATRFDKTEIYKPLGGRNFSSGKMVPYDYEKLQTDKDYLHVVKSSISKNRFLVEFFIKPTLEHLTNLKAEVSGERKRLLSKYN